MNQSHKDAQKPTVAIGIPAYNEEKNIQNLLQDLLNQNQQSYNLEAIFVESDGSSDKTVELVTTLAHPKISINDNKDRRGQAERQNTILRVATADIVVLLNADVKIKDRDFITKLVAPIIAGQADFTSSDMRSLNTSTFFEKTLKISNDMKSELFQNLKNGNNIYNCHGAARALSRDFYRKLKFIASVGEDAYSYLFCVKSLMRFKYVPEAVVYIKSPSNLKDHIRQSTRYYTSKTMYYDRFGKAFTQSQYAIPLNSKVKIAKKYLIKSPIHLIHYCLILFFVKVNLIFHKSTSNNLWEQSQSSKDLS